MQVKVGDKVTLSVNVECVRHEYQAEVTSVPDSERSEYNYPCKITATALVDGEEKQFDRVFLFDTKTNAHSYVESDGSPQAYYSE